MRCAYAGSECHHRYGGLRDASNGLANFFNLICLATIPNTVYYPVKSAADLLLTAAMSVFLFKEKLRPAQYVGVGLGALALIFINI